MPKKTVLSYLFQSTPSQEGEPLCVSMTISAPSDFNPLPRKRENQFTGNVAIAAGISIHSLARGRTLTVMIVYLHRNNFNPLPRKRENRTPTE